MAKIFEKKYYRKVIFTIKFTKLQRKIYIFKDFDFVEIRNSVKLKIYFKLIFDFKCKIYLTF